MYELVKGLISVGASMGSTIGAEVVVKGIVDTVVNFDTLTKAEQIGVKVLKVAGPTAIGAAVGVAMENELDGIKNTIDSYKTMISEKKNQKKGEKSEKEEVVKAKKSNKKIDKDEAIEVAYEAEA